MHILVTGGARSIGFYTLIEIYNADYTSVVVNNISNSNSEFFMHVAGILRVSTIPLYEVDVHNA